MSNSTLKPVSDATSETEPTPLRRIFSAEYKAKILAECDSVTDAGGIGAILRREGLYSSQLTDWRRRRASEGLPGLAPKKTGRPPKPPAQRAAEDELHRLRRENAVLQEKLRCAGIIIEAQKKLSEILELRKTKNGNSE